MIECVCFLSRFVAVVFKKISFKKVLLAEVSCI